MVTFTDAATAELRDRIHRILLPCGALAQLVGKDQCNPEDIIASLNEQLRGFFGHEPG